MRYKLITAVSVVVGGSAVALAVANTASAHTNSSSATCDGLHALATSFEDGDTNAITVFIDGVPVASVADFGTGYNNTFPFPQDGQVHSWNVTIDSSDNQWDSSVGGEVGPCGTVETTEPETTLPDTTEPVETTQPDTTEPVETTQPDTTVPETTEPVDTTIPETTVPNTTTPGTTVPGSTTTVVPSVEISTTTVCEGGSEFILVTFDSATVPETTQAFVSITDTDGNVLWTETLPWITGMVSSFDFPEGFTTVLVTVDVDGLSDTSTVSSDGLCEPPVTTDPVETTEPPTETTEPTETTDAPPSAQRLPETR
jgi:hypothetical protein